MFRMIKFLFFLGVIGGVGLVGFAYFGDLSPEQRSVTEPVSFDAR